MTEKKTKTPPDGMVDVAVALLNENGDDIPEHHRVKFDRNGNRLTPPLYPPKSK